VFTATLGRVDRSALARRERALKIFGFAELEKGLYIRPNNINLALPTLIQKLRKLGVESEAIIAQASGYSPEVEQRIQALWDAKALNKRYQSISKTLENWMSQAATLPLEVAARESCFVGGNAINTTARDAFIDLVLRFDQVGKEIWTQLREAGFMASDVATGATPA
jgi:phenylacetic acid degradation operon negative regulatory protein